jgi:hypothetical protein
MTHLKLIMLIIGSITIHGVYSQTISKKDFINTEWFVDNRLDFKALTQLKILCNPKAKNPIYTMLPCSKKITAKH